MRRCPEGHHPGHGGGVAGNRPACGRSIGGADCSRAAVRSARRRHRLGGAEWAEAGRGPHLGLGGLLAGPGAGAGQDQPGAAPGCCGQRQEGRGDRGHVHPWQHPQMGGLGEGLQLGPLRSRLQQPPRQQLVLHGLPQGRSRTQRGQGDHRVPGVERGQPEGLLPGDAGTDGTADQGRPCRAQLGRLGSCAGRRQHDRPRQGPGRQVRQGLRRRHAQGRGVGSGQRRLRALLSSRQGGPGHPGRATSRRSRSTTSATELAASRCGTPR